MGVDSPQTPLVEGRVMRHKRQSLDSRSDLAPHVGKRRCILGIAARETVDRRNEGGVIVGVGTDQPVDALRRTAAANDDHAYAAYARALPVGRLEIDRRNRRRRPFAQRIFTQRTCIPPAAYCNAAPWNDEPAPKLRFIITSPPSSTCSSAGSNSAHHRCHDHSRLPAASKAPRRAFP